jgi:hypothetical protein
MHALRAWVQLSVRQNLARLRTTTPPISARRSERVGWETDVEADPMVTTSLRLSKSVLGWVRQQAESERIRPTALIRRGIEEQRHGQTTDVSDRLGPHSDKG